MPIAYDNKFGPDHVAPERASLIAHRLNEASLGTRDSRIQYGLDAYSRSIDKELTLEGAT